MKQQQVSWAWLTVSEQCARGLACCHSDMKALPWKITQEQWGFQAHISVEENRQYACMWMHADLLAFPCQRWCCCLEFRPLREHFCFHIPPLWCAVEMSWLNNYGRGRDDLKLINLPMMCGLKHQDNFGSKPSCNRADIYSPVRSCPPQNQRPLTKEVLHLNNTSSTFYAIPTP